VGFGGFMLAVQVLYKNPFSLAGGVAHMVSACLTILQLHIFKKSSSFLKLLTTQCFYYSTNENLFN
jgi:hypothetical protein